jgi:hypothetical protein
MPTRNKLGSEPGLLFFCLGGLVVIADPIITSESPDTKTQPAYADRASEKVCLVLSDLSLVAPAAQQHAAGSTSHLVLVPR